MIGLLVAAAALINKQRPIASVEKKTRWRGVRPPHVHKSQRYVAKCWDPAAQIVLVLNPGATIKQMSAIA